VSSPRSDGHAPQPRPQGKAGDGSPQPSTAIYRYNVMRIHLKTPPKAINVPANQPIIGYRVWVVAEAPEPAADYDWVRGIEARECQPGNWTTMMGRRFRWDSYAAACQKAGLEPEEPPDTPHRAPRISCTCGIVAWRRTRSLPSDPVPPVLTGVVVGWGRVVVKGPIWRAQYARELAILFGTTADANELRRLADRDNVPLLDRRDPIVRRLARAGGLPSLKNAGLTSEPGEDKGLWDLASAGWPTR
jgi:hypothetical protein